MIIVILKAASWTVDLQDLIFCIDSVVLCIGYDSYSQIENPDYIAGAWTRVYLGPYIKKRRGAKTFSRLNVTHTIAL